jgi:hypothetical protein
MQRLQDIRDVVYKGLLLSASFSFLVAFAYFLQLDSSVFPGSQAAATPLAVTQGFPSYSGYPMPNYCYGGEPDYVQNRMFCNPGISDTGLIGVFSAYKASTPSSGQTALLRVTKGQVGTPAYYWANGRTCEATKSGTVCWWTNITQQCTSAQLGQTRNEGGSIGITTCEDVQSFTSYPLTYTPGSIGSSVSVAPGEAVALQWSCQNSQNYQTAYCAKFAPFSGTCWDHKGVNSGNQNYASGSTGTSVPSSPFSTGNQLYGQTTVYPNVTTTYSVSCTGYRNVLRQSVDTSPNCITETTPRTCTKNGSCTGPTTTRKCSLNGPSAGSWGFSALHNGIADSTASHQALSLTVTVADTATCTLNASPTSVLYGDNTSLTYSFGGNVPVTSASISPRPGSVNTTPQAYTDTVLSDTPYTLTLNGGAGSCQRAVTVDCSATGGTKQGGTCVCASGYAMQGNVCRPVADVCNNIPGTQATAPNNCVVNGSGACVGAPGYVLQGSQCVAVPEPIITITASPALARPNSTPTITWSAQNVSSCVVSGPGISSTALSGSAPTSPIRARSVYTIACTKTDGTAATPKSVTVNPVPVFEEQ